MSSWNSPNPYTSPVPGSNYGGRSTPPSKAKVLAPAICLIIAASLGLIFSIFSAFAAVFLEPTPVDPNLPPMMKAFQEGAHGPVAAIIQAVFIFVNIAIIAGGIMMTQYKVWVFALIACILSCINIGNCCCFLGLPVGIWGIVVLSMADVKAAFDANR